MTTSFPLTDATIEQVAAYFRYFIEKRDARVIVWAAVFLGFSLAPAVIIDLLLLPVRAYDRLAPSLPRDRTPESAGSLTQRQAPPEA